MTNHKFYFHSSRQMPEIADESVNLVVTSPPYPMIEMWDETMAWQDQQVTSAIKSNNGQLAFECMHQILDDVWRECYRVLIKGGFLCVNIGDATRTLDGEFRLFNNQARIVDTCTKVGFKNLPNIIWRKRTNAPNKFMGSGMLPCGAYVTLEHEMILIFRKGRRRSFKTKEEKEERWRSAFFWEERNTWFSDLWELNGTRQDMPEDYDDSRKRNGSFPVTIPLRLIYMFSQIGDVVLDPFVGLGRTSTAAVIAERGSIGYDIQTNLKQLIQYNFENPDFVEINRKIQERFTDHLEFVNERKRKNQPLKHFNQVLNCPVMTKQETELSFKYFEKIIPIMSENLEFECHYGDIVKPTPPFAIPRRKTEMEPMRESRIFMY